MQYDVQPTHGSEETLRAKYLFAQQARPISAGMQAMLFYRHNKPEYWMSFVRMATTNPQDLGTEAVELITIGGTIAAIEKEEFVIDASAREYSRHPAFLAQRYYGMAEALRVYLASNRIAPYCQRINNRSLRKAHQLRDRLDYIAEFRGFHNRKLSVPSAETFVKAMPELRPFARRLRTLWSKMYPELNHRPPDAVEVAVANPTPRA